MGNVIRQTVTFKASPQELFRTYLDSKRHAAVIGDRVSINQKVGAAFTAFDGSLRGKNLLIVPNRLIVQTWRAKPWKTTDPDSILVLQFSKAKIGGQIRLTHVNVPDHDYQTIKHGWPKYYWTPWKAYLKRRVAKS